MLKTGIINQFEENKELTKLSAASAAAWAALSAAELAISFALSAAELAILSASAFAALVAVSLADSAAELIDSDAELKASLTAFVTDSLTESAAELRISFATDESAAALAAPTHARAQITPTAEKAVPMIPSTRPAVASPVFVFPDSAAFFLPITPKTIPSMARIRVK